MIKDGSSHPMKMTNENSTFLIQLLLVYDQRQSSDQLRHISPPLTRWSLAECFIECLSVTRGDHLGQSLRHIRHFLFMRDTWASNYMSYETFLSVRVYSINWR